MILFLSFDEVSDFQQNRCSAFCLTDNRLMLMQVHLQPLAITSIAFDHCPTLRLVSFLPGSQKAQNDFHHRGYTEVAYNLFSKKSCADALLPYPQGQVSSCAAICLGHEDLRGERQTVCSVSCSRVSSRVSSVRCSQSQQQALCIWSFKDLTIEALGSV